jgi:hypothetical protein
MRCMGAYAGHVSEAEGRVAEHAHGEANLPQRLQL